MRIALLAGVALLVMSLGAAEWTNPGGEALSLSVPHEPGLTFADGFKATVRFRCDFTKPSPGGFKNLFCKGTDFLGGYCVMLRDDGDLLVYLKDITGPYRIVPTGFASGREYLLEVYVTKEVVRVFVDGAEQGGYPYLGRFDFSTEAPLQLGSMGSYTFFGSLPLVRLEPIASVVVPPGGPMPMLHEAPSDQTCATIEWTKTICREEDRYIGWPTVCRLACGDIIVVFSGDRDEHVCPWGKVQLVRSTDGGETWSAPKTIVNGPLDDRDAGVVQLPDGTVLVTYFTSDAYRAGAIAERKLKPGDVHYDWQRHDEKISDKVRTRELGYFRIVSTDNGQTWSDPVRMENVGDAPHGPAVLNDGSLLMLGRTYRKVGDDYYTVIGCWRSTDLGANWSCLCADVPATGDENAKPQMFHEPHCLQLPNGRIVGLVRYHGEDNCMRVTFSDDGGRTWTPMRNSGMPGLPPYLVRLPDGRLLNVYGRRFAVTSSCGEYAALSEDGGETWDVANEIVLNPCAFSSDLGYPSTCVLGDGSLLTVYYQRPSEAIPKPQLMATKWRVKGKQKASGLAVLVSKREREM